MCGVQVCTEKNKQGYEFELQMAEKKMQKKPFILVSMRFFAYNWEILSRRGISVLGDIFILFSEQPPSQIHTMTRSHSSSTVPMAEAPKVLCRESLTHLATADGLLPANAGALHLQKEGF